MQDESVIYRRNRHHQFGRGSSCRAERYRIYALNRGGHPDFAPQGAEQLTADINDEDAVRELIGSLKFDAVADFVAYLPIQVGRDIRLFSGKTRQFIFISSASAYRKPAVNYRITESTPLRNPYWRYSRDKIACEETPLAAYRSNGFPVIIVRPNRTYGDTNISVPVHEKIGSRRALKRIQSGKPVIARGAVFPSEHLRTTPILQKAIGDTAASGISAGVSFLRFYSTMQTFCPECGFMRDEKGGLPAA